MSQAEGAVKAADDVCVPEGMTRAQLVRQDSTRLAHHDHSQCKGDDMYCVIRRCVGELHQDLDMVYNALQPVTQMQTEELADKMKQVAEERLMKAEHEVTDIHTSVKPDICPLLLNVYMWLAICKLGNSLGVQVGSGSLVYVLDRFLSPFLAMFLSLVGLPFMVGYWYVDQLGLSCDQQQPIPVFILTVVQGVLSGYSIFRHRVLMFWTPPSFVFPLVVGLNCIFMGPYLTHNHNRTMFVTAILTPPMIIVTLVGLSLGSAGTNFYVWLAIRAATLFINLQLKIGTLQNEGTIKPQVLIFSMACSQMTQIFIAYMLGYSLTEFAEQNDFSRQ